MEDKLNLTEALKELEEINNWFENQDEVDVEQGLEKVKEGVKLVKASQSRLKDIQNEFEEIKKDISKNAEPAEEKVDHDPDDEEEPEEVAF
jgi:exodeoxyribonuclease VII small subunit